MMKRFLQGWSIALVAVAAIVSACGQQAITGVCDPTDASCNPTDTTPGTGATPLQIVQVSPTDGATDVDPGTTVTVTFNRAVAPATVTSSSFSVGTVEGSRSVDGAKVTFTPDATFAEGAGFDVSVDGVTDAEGVGLSSAFSSSFTTKSFPIFADAGADFDASMAASVTLDKGSSTGSGATFAWTQLSGPDVGALSGDSPTFTAPAAVSSLSFELSVSDGSTTDVDTVRVWILEDADHAIWVSPDGAPSNPGTRDAPLSTIQDGIDAADNGGNGADVYVAAGNYDETLSLRSRVSVYGGFDPADWTRDIDAFRPVVSGSAVAVSGNSANDLTLEGLEIIAADAVGTGATSIAILLEASDGVLLTHNIITSGDGTTGAEGSQPDRAHTGSYGGYGGDAKECLSRTAGGGGGTNYRSGGTGGLGAYSNPTGGGKGSGTYGGNAGGAGTSSSKNGGDGGDGKANGAKGGDGDPGAAFGALGADGSYDPNAASGTTGYNGGAGYGGGGGGGAYGFLGACGGSGGGGGGGGQGGTPGTPGSGGGASFGIVLVGLSVAEIVDNEILTGTGGTGGAGGTGGYGGYGGLGRSGGNRACDSIITSLCTGSGGDGGNGTTGGQGGHGGGGGGGPSIGVIAGPDATPTLSANVFTLGAGGAGGSSAGSAGATGENVEFKQIS